ncbi:hypothetical protein H0I31_06280 [Tenacibaculum sp. AHE15PA]|uniref:hypothetical protein n=1 Tax=unclassified Tenacibaculum TaxID=2635139 RepID=UPI001C4E351D|nr:MULTISPECIES: hypothetical protein [unclassified Tenacibaculum]QXP73300.1 hypothetical protein H0I30_11540 [Tenacibaculum sp. AHE14PA]QXP77213.1 hypothetical protein H0I31_06280 [Tenacibaculum sp. AHE15PA]
MTKKETIEKSIFDKFRKSYPEFPSGRTEHIDKPDFIIHSKQKIGVEITQIFKDDYKSNKGSLLKSIEEITRRVSEEILNLFREKQIPRCYLIIHLNKNEFPLVSSPNKIAEIFFNDIIKNINKKKKNYILEIDNNGDLPKIVESYKLIFDEKIKDYEYIELYSTVGKEIDSLKIQNILNKKEKAKITFEKCDKYWLVIKSGELSADYLPSIQITSKRLRTTFDKIFILKYLENELIEIK